MVCRAIGYTAQAKELVGSWPANYIALAQQLGLYDDVIATATTDRASAAQIIYNALPVTLVYINADGTTQAQSGLPSMLKNLGGYELNGGDGVVLTSAMAESAEINVNAYVGQFVNAWVNKSDHIIAVEVLSTTVEGKLKIADKTLGEYYISSELFNVAGTATNFQYDLKATTPSAARLVTNGKTGGAAPAFNSDTSGVTLAVKLNGKTIQEVYSVIDWTKVGMDQFDADNLNMSKLTIKVDGDAYKFEKDKNGDIDTSKFALIGVTSLDKIAKDNIVEIYTDNGLTTGKITKIAVGTKTVTGTVTKVNLDDEEYYIDGVAYSLTTTGSAATAGTMITAPSVGDTGTAYLNYDGDIAVWDADDATAGNYAIYTGSEADTDAILGTNVTKVGLFLKDGGSVKKFEMASGYTTSGGIAPSTLANPKIVSYSLNKDGKINTDIVPATGLTTTSGIVNANRTAFADIKFADNVVVFIHDGSDWTVGSLKDLKTNASIDLTYCLDSKGKIACIAGLKGGAVKQNDSYGVINSVAYSLDASGDKVWHVAGFMDGKVLDADTDKSGSTQPYNKSEDVAALGSLYKITVDGQGTVIGVVPVGAGDNQGNASYVDCTGGAVVTETGSKQVDVTIAAGSRSLALTDDVVVYTYDSDKKRFELGTLGDCKNNQISVLALMDAADFAKDGRYNIIIVW